MCIYRICVLIYVDLRICIYVCTYTVYMYTGYILFVSKHYAAVLVCVYICVYIHTCVNIHVCVYLQM